MKKILLILGIILFLNSCSDSPEIKIAISRGSGSQGYEQYEKWINQHYPDAECIDMYNLSLNEATKTLEKCSGLILSGGPDVHPEKFGKGFDTLRCSIDGWRDTLEFALIEKAKKLKLPVLGICRGLQILNVAYGGSLIVDIPEDVENNIIHQDTTSNEVFHSISIEENCYIYEISGLKEGVVNSNHHQAIDRLANKFKATSFTEDGIIESIEFKDYKNKHFLLAVQWHPERLEKTKKLSTPIAESFINAAKEYFRYYAYKAN